MYTVTHHWRCSEPDCTNELKSFSEEAWKWHGWQIIIQAGKSVTEHFCPKHRK